MRATIFAVLFACGGTPKAPVAEPPALSTERTIDCAKLTDHVIEAQLVGSADTKEDVAVRRAKMLADCPKAWSADHPSDAQLKTTDCMMAATTGPEVNQCVGLPAYEAILRTPRSGIPACDDYAAKVESLLHCTNVAQATRDQIREQFEKATTGWAAIPEDAKAKLAQDCGVGVGTVKQIASSMKCDL